MKKIYSLFLSAFLLISLSAGSQVTLTGTGYLETFDNIGTGLPAGWTVKTGATATALGTPASLTAAATAWNNSTGAFKNFASADGLFSGSPTTDQNASADRSLGLRQTGTIGDPGAAFVVQLENTSGLTGFTLSFKLQSLDATSPRTATWKVDYGIGASPASFTSVTTSPATITTGNSTFANNTVTVNFGPALDNIGQNVWIRMVTLTATSGSGNRPSTAIDDFQLNYLQGGSDVTAPSIAALSPANNAVNVVYTSPSAAITFDEPIQKGSGSIVLKKTSDNTIVQNIDASSANVTVSNNTATFPISLQQNTGYYIEIPGGAFKDIAGNNFSGISGNTGWKFSTGSLIFSAPFNTCSSSLTEGFSTFSVTGNEVWACTAFGRDSSNPAGSAANGVQINGYSNGTNVPNEDWLISPPLNLAATTYPLLTFWSRTAFNGAPMQLKVSTNYTGTGDPRTAIWTDVNGRFPAQASDVWTVSSQVNLSAFKQSGVYFAFVYVSSNEEGARWTLDDISVENSATPPAASLTTSTTDIQFGFAAAGSSATKTFTVTGNDLTSGITISSSANFLVSSNGTDFSSSVTYTQAAANNVPETLYVKYSPLLNDQNYKGTVTVSTSGLTNTVNLTGTSIDPAKTLDVVNWNMEWFGSTTFGPTNDSLQQENARKVLQSVGADLYALVEIVDTARLGNVVRSMPGYSFVVSNFGSHTNPTVSGDGPLSEAQKLGFVYKTSMFSNVSTMPLLNLTTNTAADAASKNYQNWSSGRYPFMMNADVTLNGTTKNIKFIVIHAKANTSPTDTSYKRRKNGADSLYALLNKTYPNDNIIILGDFNDDLDSTITAGITPRITSYSSFVNDSVNYPAITLALSRAGKKSTVSYNDMIDQVVVSNEMKPYYMEGSVNVLTDVTSLIANYGTTTTDHYPVYSRYAFDAAILPIKLIAFNAVKNGSAIDLTWKTAQEINSKAFIVEHSTDAIHFNAIGSVSAAGTSSVEKSYLFTDNSPSDGNNYYRLNQVDKDNSSELSKVVKVTLGFSATVSLSPNPAKDVVNIVLNNFGEGVSIELIDINGKVVKQRSVNNGSFKTTLELNGVSKGLYLLKIANNKIVTTQKLIIQ